MLDLIRQISSIPCVNGSEFLLAKYIQEYFSEKGFNVSIDNLNNVIVRKDYSHPDPDVIFFTPMDSPGYVCLYFEDSEAFLTPTSAAVKDLDDVQNVTDFDGNVYSVEKSKYDEKAFFVKTSSVDLGDAFSISGILSEDEEKICGRFAARFVCVATLMKFAETCKNPNVAFCFSSGFNTSFKTESSVINQLRTKRAILLGFAESSTNDPILCIKDGKAFSSKNLLAEFLSSCKNSDVSVSQLVFDKSITSAERLFSPFVSEILSLAIPCKDALKNTESVSKYAPNRMLKALHCLEMM